MYERVVGVSEFLTKNSDCPSVRLTVFICMQSNSRTYSQIPKKWLLGFSVARSIFKMKLEGFGNRVTESKANSIFYY